MLLQIIAKLFCFFIQNTLRLLGKSGKISDYLVNKEIKEIFIFATEVSSGVGYANKLIREGNTTIYPHR